MHKQIQQVENQLESKNEEFVNQKKLVDFIQEVRNDEKVALAAQKKIVLAAAAAAQAEAELAENAENEENEKSDQEIESEAEQQLELQRKMLSK